MKKNSVPGLAERISALTDGQLEQDQFAQTVSELLSDVQCQQTWLTYHVVGDAMRSAELVEDDCGMAFLTRFEQRLAMEPLSPLVQNNARPDGKALTTAVPALPGTVERRSANGEVFRWKMLAGVACTMVFGAVGWGLWNQSSTAQGSAQLSAMPEQGSPASALAVQVTDAGVMIRDPRLDELMAAHRQVGGYSALQLPAGFLRNATYEGAQR